LSLKEKEVDLTKLVPLFLGIYVFLVIVNYLSTGVFLTHMDIVGIVLLSLAFFALRMKQKKINKK
jgi:hypothetical protein